MSDGLLDERVVEMRFDNADFERNVNQSIKTIDKLKESLDFENAGESFENISAAAAKCDMKPLEDSLEGITVKFNMLEMVAANVLGNITSKIVDAGAKMAKSLTVDQLTAGWAKYDQKTAAVQTIISATSESIDVVNQKLEKLIWFADETSYDFVDMVNNIGKFTSAGVDLDTAVDSMMGISNWAAASGAGIQQASRAMYNLSQAIGMGYVGLTDWRSIELANMATKEFKETVIETALEMGTLQQTADGTVKTLNGKFEVTAENMRNSLKEQWFSTDVLNSALKKYNEFANLVHDHQEQWAEEHDGAYLTVSRTIQLLESEGVAMDTLGAKAFMRAQEATKFSEAVAATADAVSSGWMRTFEIIFGNYEQAKKLWTDLANDMYDVFASGGERRNDMLSDIMQSNYQKMLNEMPDGNEMNDRLYDKLYEMTKNNLGVDAADQLFSAYTSLEDLLKDNADYIYNSSLEDAFKQVAVDFDKEADAALKLSKQLKAGTVSLKQTVLRLVGGQFGNEIETQKKEVEKLGYNYEMLSELAEEYKAGLEIPWDQYQSDFVEYLDEQYSSYKTFVKKITELLPEEGFFGSLTEFGGRDKLIGGFQNLIDTFKNLYLTIVEIGNGISDLTGSGSFLEKLINGFSFFTNVLNYSDEAFEGVQEGIYNFFHGGLQTKWNRFWHGYDVKDVLENNKAAFSGFWGDIEKAHVPGMLDHIFSIYKDHLAVLPANVSKTIEKVRVELSTFFGSIPQKINEIKEKIFGKFEIHEVQSLFSNNVDTVITHTGGLLNDLKDKIRSLGNGLGGKIFDELLNTIKKVADFMFGYQKEDGTPIEGAFVRIYDKATAFWERLKDIGKKLNDIFSPVKDFFFGIKDAEGKIIKNNIFGKFGTAVRILVDSPAYKSIHDFLFGRKNEKGETEKKNIFGKIGTAIDLIAKSSAYQSIHDFIFGKKGENGSDDIPNLFGKISGLIIQITESSAYKSIHDFVFGGGQENEPNIFYKIKYAVQDIFDSPAFQAIHDFIFGKKTTDSGMKNAAGGIFSTKEQLEQLNLFERIRAILYDIKTLLFGYDKETLSMDTLEETVVHVDGKLTPIIQKIKDITKAVINAVNNFRRWLGLDWEKTDDGFKRIPGAIDSIKAKYDAFVSSEAFQTVKRFIFGEKDSEGNAIQNNIFGKLGIAIGTLKEQAKNLPDTFLTFFLGPVNEEGKRTENLFKRLPGYIQKAKTGIMDFFLGQKKYAGRIWNNETGQWEDRYIREGNLIDRLKEKFEQLKADHPWFASFCSYIETKIRDIKKIFADANGSVTTALENLRKYLFGYDVDKKGGLFNLSDQTEHIQGLFGRLKESISSVFSGNKKEGNNFIETILDFFTNKKINNLNVNIGSKESPIVSAIKSIILTIASLKLLLFGSNLSGLLASLKRHLDISDFIDTLGEFATSIALIAGTLIVLTGFVKILKGNYESLKIAGWLILGIMGALVLFVNLISDIEIEKKDGTKFEKSVSPWVVTLMTTLGIIIAEIAAIMAIMMLVVKIAGPEVVQEAANIITGIFIALAVLVAAISYVPKDSDAKKMATKSTALFGIAAILLAMTPLLLSMAAVFVSLSVLRHFDTNWEAELWVLGGMLGFITAFIVLLQALPNKGVNLSLLGGLALIAIMIKELGAIITSFSLLAKLSGSYSYIIAAAASIGGLLVVIGLLAAGLSAIKPINGSVIASIVAIAVVIAAIGGAISLMISVSKDLKNMDLLLSILQGMTTLLLGITASLVILSGIKKIDWKAFGYLGMMIVAVGLLGGLVAALSWLGKQAGLENSYTAILPMLAGIVEIAGTMIIVAAAIYAMGAIGKAIAPMVGEAILMILGVVGVVGVLAAIPQIIDHFAGEGTVLESIEYLVQIIETLAGGLGKAIGAFIGGIGSGLVDSFTGVVDSLVKVANKIKDEFLPAISEFTLEDAVQAGMMATIMLGAFTAEALGALTVLIDALVPNGAIESTLDNLIKVATKLRDEFLPAINDFSSTHAAKAGLMATIMLGAFAAETFGSFTALLDNITGNGAIEKALDGLISIANKLKADFIPAVKDFSTTDVTKAGYLSGIMLGAFKAETFGTFSELVSRVQKDGQIDKVIDGLVNIAGKLNQDFLPAIKDLSYTHVSSAGYLSKIMLEVLKSEVFTAASSFVGIFVKGGDLDNVVTGLCETTENLKTKFLPVVKDLSEDDVKKAGFIPKILGSVLSSQVFTGLSKLTSWLTGDTNYVELFGKLTQPDGVIDGIESFSSALKGRKFEGVSEASDAMASVFSLLEMLGNSVNIKEDTHWYDKLNIFSNDVSLSSVIGSLNGITEKIIPCIVSLQDGMRNAGIDAEYIKNTIGVYVEMLRSISEIGQNNFVLNEIDIVQIGQFVVDGLLIALQDETNISNVKQAAINLGIQIKDGLMFSLDENSPSKVAYEIGAFVAEGLTNGLRAGEGMTYSMAQRFGEGTAKALEEGLGDFDSISQHAINMVTMDLLDENRFDMKSFVSGFNRFGNEELDFEAMRKFLTDNFGEVFDQNMIEGFVNSYEQTMSKLNDTINDKDYAELMTGIAAGDFGLSENTIIDALTEELGDVKAARQAWEDYNDVKEGNLKINQELFKQQKQNPPMTLEQYMDMIAHEEEGYQRALKGEFDELARLNDTTRAQEMEKAGFNAELLQGRLNEGGLSQEQIEAYIKDKALKDYETEQTRLVDNIIRNNEAVAESTTEVAEALNFDIDDPLGEKLAIKDAAALKEVAGAAEEVAEAQQSVAETAEAKAEAVEAETAAVEASNNANKEAAKVNRDGAVFKSLDKVELGQAIEAFREGKKLTEEQTRIIENARQATISEGAFGVAIGEKGWADQMKKWGLTETNAKYLAHFANFYDPTTQSLEEYVKWVEKSDEVTEDLTKSTENAGESAKKTGTSLANIADDGKAVVDIFKHAFSTDAYNEKTGSFSIDFEKAYQDSIADAEKAGDETRKKYLEAFYSGLGEEGFNKVGDNGKIELKAEDVFKLVGTEGGIKGFAAAKGGELLGNLIGENIPFLGDIFGNTKEFDFTQIFSGTDSTMSFFKGLVASVTGLNKELDETSDKKVDIDVNDSKVESAISMVDELNKKYTLGDDEKKLAAQGIKDLQNGVKVTEKSADAIQKLWNGAMIGMYKSGEERITAIKQLLNLDNFDWETLSSLLDENGNFDITKQTSTALDQADKVIQMATNGETYSTADLMNDIYAGKWGYDTDRLKALEKAGYDAQKVQENFLKWYNGDKTIENLGDDYFKVSESEKEAAEQAEKMNAVLNQTPEGAFRSVADFLDGVNKAVENEGTASAFKKLMTDISESMKTLTLSDASNFEKVAGFLTAVRTAAKESSTIAQDFKAFVDGIKDSVTQLGDIDIKNPEGMDKVKDFLNNIKIENKDTLEAVSSFIGNIVEFATGANAGGDYSTKLTESIDALMTSINGIELNKEAITPVVKFLHELTNSAGILEKSDSGVVQTFISNLYTALENSSDKAAQAADVIAQVIVDTLAGYYSQLNTIGHNFVWWLARGILKSKNLAQSAGESIAGALMNSLKDYAVTKSQKSGSDFVSNFVTGMNSPESQKVLQRALDNLFNPKTEAKDLPSGADALAEKLAMKNGKEAPESEKTEPQQETGPSAGTKFGQQFIQDMSAAIEQSAGTVGQTLSTLGDTLAASVKIDTEGVSKQAGEFVQNLAVGLTTGLEANQTALDTVISTINSCIASAVPDGHALGYSYMEGIYRGLLDGANDYNLGGFLPEGLAQGMQDGQEKVKKAGWDLFKAGEKGVSDAGKINSPSRVFMRLGKYLVEGLAIGIEDNVGLAKESTENMGNMMSSMFTAAVSNISDLANEEMNLDPVIRPVIDMSDVYDSANTIDAMLSSDKAIDISAAENAKNMQSADSMSEVTPGTQVFNQYNYSPKALSRLEIYRQTRNQFAMIKGVNQSV